MVRTTLRYAIGWRFAGNLPDFRHNRFNTEKPLSALDHRVVHLSKRTVNPAGTTTE